MDQVVCRFFATSGCRDGAKCLFPHIYGTNLMPDNICCFFMKGSCTFGKNCRFAHVIVWKGAVSDHDPSSSGPPEMLRIPDIYLQNFQYLTDNSMLIPFMPNIQCEILAEALHQHEYYEAIVRYIDVEIVPEQIGAHDAYRHLTIQPATIGASASEAAGLQLYGNYEDIVRNINTKIVPEQIGDAHDHLTIKPATFGASASGSQLHDVYEDMVRCITVENVPEKISDAYHHLTIKPATIEESVAGTSTKRWINIFGLNVGFEKCVCLETFQSICTEAYQDVFFSPKNNSRYLEVEMQTSLDGKCSMNLSQIGDTRNCSFCRKIILSRKGQGENQFGLLQNCDDVFCLKCILSWNGISIEKNKIVYSNVDIICPECKRISNYLISSRVWLRSQEKAVIIKSYENRSMEKLKTNHEG